MEKPNNYFTTLINSLIKNFANFQYKLESVIIIFKFFNLLGDENKQKFVSGLIRNYINASDSKWLNSLLDALESGESRVKSESKEEIWYNVTQRSYTFIDSGTQPDNSRLFIRILEHYEDDKGSIEKFVDKFTNQNYNILISIIRSNRYELKKEIVNIIYKVLLERSKHLNHDQQRQISNLLTELKEMASQEYIDNAG